MKRTVHVIPHTHWDREWYFTLTDSNIILDQNLSALISYLTENQNCGAFLFDGQTSVIHDYLRIRPEQESKLKELVKHKKLLIGPWVTQCDTRLISHESIIRNLKMGVDEANKIGHCFKIGYIPDAFGQNSYLPSIFNQFELPYAVIQRGIANHQLTSQDLNVNWVSPDGQNIMTHYIYFGYGSGKFLSSDSTYFKHHLDPILTQLSKLNQHTDHLALPAGGDQILFRPQLTDVIEQLNMKQSNYHFKLSDYTTMMNQIKDEIGELKTTIYGELMNCQKSRIHKTIASSRYDIKYLNSLIEHRILYQLEPLMVYAHTQDIQPFTQSMVDEMWRKLFDVHAHDSISGCNSDRTNRMIIERLNEVCEQVDGMINVFMRYLTQDIKDESLFLFNPLLRAHTQSLEVDIYTKLPSFKLVNKQGEEVNMKICMKETIDGGSKVIATAKGEQIETLPPYYHFKVLIQDLHFDSFSPTVLQLVENHQHHLPKLIKSVENNWMRLMVENNQLYLFNKQTKIKQPLLSIVDDADQGDTYDFAYIKDDTRIYATIDQETIVCEDFEEYQQMTFDYVISLPLDILARLDHKNEVMHRIETKIKCQKSGAIFIEHQINNQVKEHRIRSIIHLQGNVKSKQAFGMIERKHEAVDWIKEGYVEQPLPVDVIDQMIQINGEERFYLLSQNMKEYEVSESGIELTWFRSVPYLGKDNLTTRPGRASGINNTMVETPDSLMLTKMTFKYGITPNQDWQSDYHGLYETMLAYQKQSLNSLLHRLDRFELPKLETKQIEHIFKCNAKIYQSSLRLQDDYYVLRLANLTDMELAVDLEIDSSYEVKQVALNEKTVQQSFDTLKPNHYSTWMIRKRLYEQ